MAEYVRRKRPPASHPYWARLYDRAHPPAIVLPVAIPAATGMVLGLAAGVNEPFTSGDAARVAAEVAGGSAGILLVVGVVVLRVDASRPTPRRERWAEALIGVVGLAAAVFALTFGPTFLALLCYSASSGQGPLFGMLIGSVLGGIPFGLMTLVARRRWRVRQRRWPRWERMRGPRGWAVLSVTRVSSPPLSPIPLPTPWPPIGNGQ